MRPRPRFAVILLVNLAMLSFTLLAGPTGFSVLDRVRETKTLTFAYSAKANPISFNDESGLPSGYAVDLCKRIAASIQYDLGLDRLDIRWVEGNTPRRVAALANREADLECGNTTMDLQRQGQVDFSNIVFVASGAVLVLADSGIGSIPDLAGKRIAVVPETTTERRLRKEFERRLIDGDLVPVSDAKDGVDLLVAGKADAVASDRLVLIGQVAATGTPERFAILDTQFSLDPYALALVRNDADFRLAVNRGLARIYRSGEIDRIFARWFGTDAKPTELLGGLFHLFGFSD